MAQRSFSPDLFRFLTELRRNNNREWFAQNKKWYEEAIQEPAMEFIIDFAPVLRRISPHFRADARPVGGSLFRIYRDTRFSKDKSPYKTNTGIHFRHEVGKDAHAPGFYLHLARGEVFVAAGIWHPDRDALHRIRQAIVDKPDQWKRATRAKPFAGALTFGGDVLRRPPPGFDPAHPLIEDLKHKDFVAYTTLSEEAVTAEGFLEEYGRICRAGGPFVRFLCGAVGVPF